MSEAIVIPSGGGEIVGDSAHRRVEILSDEEMLVATWSRFGPRRDGADLHIHKQHTDMFFVLEGELTVRLGSDDRPAVVPAGQLARVPPFVVHGFRNGSDADVRYLNFHAPGERFADYLRALRDGGTLEWDQHPPPPDGGRPTSEVAIGAGDRRDGMIVLADVDAVGIAELNVDEAPQPPHAHRRHLESFYVFEGELRLRAGDRELRADSGSWVRVPPGVPHAVDGDARVLNLHTPNCGLGTLDHEPA